MEFTKIHTFPYSKREGTPASTMENQIDGLTKKKRVKEILKLSKEMEYHFYQKYLNKILPGISEISKEKKISILTTNYISVSIPNQIENNKRCLVKINKIDEENKVFGEFVSFEE